jgi:hypothetical protein
MSMGQEGDTRKFRPPYPGGVTKDISTKPAKKKMCYSCGQEIRGKIWRVDNKNVECTQCHNEGTTSPLEGDFLNNDFNILDFY